MPNGDDWPGAAGHEEQSAQRDIYSAGRDINITNSYQQAPAAGGMNYVASVEAAKKAIRISLHLLSGENGHHRFEDLCRQVAGLRIASNLLPATGPVSAGGDQGRDFETFHTYLADGIPDTAGVPAPAPDVVVFACTIQRDGLKEKFKRDIKKICTGGTPVDRIYIFAAAEVPVSLRHDIQTWAREEYGVKVEIIDGYALSEMLVGTERLFAVAQALLDLPAELAPRWGTSKETRQQAGTGWQESAFRVRYPSRLPRLADSHQDRPEQETMEAILNAGQTAVPRRDTALVTCVLAGTGGTGKTQIARAYCHKVWDDAGLPVAAWVHAGSRGEIIEAFAEIYSEITRHDGAEPWQAAKNLVEWLRSTDQRWLLVLDGLHDPRDLKELWPPDTPHGLLVVTTRDQAPSLWNGNRKLIPVGAFDESQSVAYLHDRLSADPRLLEGMTDLTDTLARLPLALNHAAAVMLARKWTAKRYQARFLDETGKLSKTVVPRPSELMPDDDYSLTIATTWRISIDLADEQTEGVAGKLLAIGSLLNSNEIPAALFESKAVVDYLRETLDRAVTADDAHEGLAFLDRLSLVTADISGLSGSVSVLPLVQRATRDEIRAHEIGRIANTAADALNDIWPESDSREYAHTAHVLYLNASTLDRLAGASLIDPEAGCHDLLTRIGDTLDSLGRPYAARDYFLDLATRATRVMGEENIHTLRIWHRAATALGRTRDRIGALKELDALCHDFQRVLGEDHPDTASIRANRASYQALNGNITDAVRELESVVRTREKILPPYHPDTLSTRARLAKWRGHSGQITQAIDELEKVLADYREHHPSETSAIFLTRASLATWRGQAGQHAMAAAEFQSILEDQIRIYGPSTWTINTRTSLIRWHREDKNWAAVKEAKRELIAEQHQLRHEFEDRYGTGNPDALTWRARMASSSATSTNTADKIISTRLLIADQEEVLTPQHPDTLESRMRLASLIGASGDQAGAVTELRDVLDLAERTQGSAHPLTLRCLIRLALWHSRAGDPDAAVDTLRVLLNRQQETHAPVKHISTTLEHLVSQYQNIDNRLGVGEALCALLAHQAAFLPPDHPEILRIRIQVAVWHAKLGMTAAAIDELRQVSEESVRILTVQHRDTMVARLELARCLWSAGRHHQARETLGLLLNDQRTHLGAEHRWTVANEQRLKSWRTEPGNTQHGNVSVHPSGDDGQEGQWAERKRQFPLSHVDPAPRISAIDNAENLAAWMRTPDARAALLEALALAMESGLPRGVWIVVANALAATAPVSEADIDALLPLAGSSITASTQAGVTAYRLSHQAVARHVLSLAAQRTSLTEEVSLQLRHRQIAQELVIQFPLDPYVFQNLPRHAALGDCLHYLSWPPAILDHIDLDILTEEVLRTGFHARSLSNEIFGALQVRHLLQGIPPGDRAVARGMVTTPSGNARRHFKGRRKPAAPAGVPVPTWTLAWAHQNRDPHHITLVGKPARSRFRKRDDEVTALAVVPHNSAEVLAVAHRDGSVELLEVGTGQRVPVEINFPESIVALAAVAGNDAQLAVIGETSVRVWGLADHGWRGELISDFEGGIQTATAIRYTDGRSLLSIIEGNGHIVLVDPQTGHSIARSAVGHERPVNDICSFPSRDAPHDCVATAGDDGQVTVWDAAPLEVSQIIATRHKGPVMSVTAVRSNKHVLLCTGGRDGAIGFWTPYSGGRKFPEFFRAHHGAVLALTPLVRPGARARLASGGEDDTVRLWNVDTGRRVGAPLTGHTARVRVLATPTLANGHQTIASSGHDASVRIWDLRDARQLGEAQRDDKSRIPKNLADNSGNTVTAITSARLGGEQDLRLVVGRRNGTIQQYSPDNGEPVSDHVQAHTSGVRLMTQLCMRDGNRYVATVGSDNIVKIWDFSGADPLTELPPTGDSEIRALTAIHRNGRDTLLAIGDRAGTVRLWDIRGRHKTRSIDAHTQPITSMVSVELDYRTTRLLTGSADLRIRFWDPDTGEHDNGPDITGNTNPIYAMALLPGPAGPVLAASGRETEGKIRCYDITTRRALPGFSVRGGDILMDQLMSLATESGNPVLLGTGRKHAIRVWRLGAAEVAHRLDIQGPIIASHAFGQKLALSTKRGLYQLSLTLPDDNAASLLSSRDIDVIREISLGHTSGEVARRLSVTPRTVNGHLRNICRKLGVNEPDQAILAARANGLIAG